MEARTARDTFERLGTRSAEAAGRLVGQFAARWAPDRVHRAFIFTDIVKSTDLVSAISDEAWEELLAWHDETLRTLFASKGGQVAHHTGDGFFVAFTSPASALECAVAVQRALAEHRRAHGFAPFVRMKSTRVRQRVGAEDYSGGRCTRRPGSQPSRREARSWPPPTRRPPPAWKPSSCPSPGPSRSRESRNRSKSSPSGGDDRGVRRSVPEDAEPPSRRFTA